MGLPNGTPTSNPAGLIYKFSIDGNCGDAYFQNHCELWQSTDLDGSQQFFSFDDIKPDDWGTNLISLHVTSNDAYICLIPNNLEDEENSIVDPETEAGDLPNQGNLPGYGELSDEIEFFGWDDDGDGIYEDATEDILISAGTSLNDI
jgi:hypothetical protein